MSKLECRKSIELDHSWVEMFLGDQIAKDFSWGCGGGVREKSKMVEKKEILFSQQVGVFKLIQAFRLIAS